MRELGEFWYTMAENNYTNLYSIYIVDRCLLCLLFINIDVLFDALIPECLVFYIGIASCVFL